MMILAFITPIMAQAASPDPTSQYTQLGVAGIAVAIIAVAWRLAEKRCEVERTEKAALISVLREVQPILARSVEVHKDAIAAEHEMTLAMKAMPPQEVWWQIRSALAAQEKSS